MSNEPLTMDDLIRTRDFLYTLPAELIDALAKVQLIRIPYRQPLTRSGITELPKGKRHRPSRYRY